MVHLQNIRDDLEIASHSKFGKISRGTSLMPQWEGRQQKDIFFFKGVETCLAMYSGGRELKT